MLSCQPGKSITDDYANWSFSGYVIDGSTQQSLPDVKIKYLDMDGESQETVTDKAGRFYISSLPYGDRSFKFTYLRTDTTTPYYTEKILVASSYSESNSVDGLFGDVSKVVVLYPLSGSVSGELYLKLNGSENVVPAKNLNIKISYNDTSLANSTPVMFNSNTDSTGVFKFSNLPLAPGAVLKINNTAYNSLTYTCEPVNISQLFKSKSAPLGRIFLTAQDSTNTLLSKVRSNVLSTDGFGLTGIPVNKTLWYILPQTPVSSSISVTLSGGESPNSTVKLKGDTIFIDPVVNFSYDTLITVTISGQDKAGNHIEFTFDGPKRFRTEKKTSSQVRSNVLSNDGYGLTNVPVDETLWYALPVIPSKTGIEVSINDQYDSSVSVSVKGDTVFVKHSKNFSYDTLIKVSFTGLDTAGNHMEYTFGDTQRFRTERRTLSQVKSNCLSDKGFGLGDVPVDIKPWYVLPQTPLSSSIAVSLIGAGSPGLNFRIDKDTVFIEPLANFTYDGLVTVIIKGVDTLGAPIDLTFDGTAQFRTEKNISAVASNTWRTADAAKKYFGLNDTLWVKYSELLDSDVKKIDWAASSAVYDIYGSGANTNADVWIHKDTLFVKPDQRLAISYGLTMGFMASVVSAGGKRSDSLDVTATIISDNYYVKWTNTKDAMGNMRQDFGTLDSVVVVSSSPIAQIKGISDVSGKTVPSDLSLDNVRLRGDTIIYKPLLYLKPDSTYGLDFDILFKDGNLRYDVLGVAWKTALKVQINSYDNRQSGEFRPFKVIGDSLSVTFSTPIDTNANASIPFKVNMTDVRYKTIKTRVKWNPACTIAKIFNIDTLPCADFGASPAYSGDATNTRAVKSVSFDLITKNGEQVLGFKPKNEDIEIHTEKGLCVVDANILLNHDNRNKVDRGENTVDNFPLNGSVRITFNRLLDTAAMNADADGLLKYAGVKQGSTDVGSTVSFSTDGKTIIITPEVNLESGVSYYVWLKNIPGMGISSATAINTDSGKFSGKSSNYNVLDKAFQAK